MLREFIFPLEYSQTELKFINWCMNDATGADLRKLSDWLKRVSILDSYEKHSVIELMRQFATMNTGRVSKMIVDALNNDRSLLCRELSNSDYLQLKQKDIASLLEISPSTLSKLKNNNNGRKFNTDCP